MAAAPPVVPTERIKAAVASNSGSLYQACQRLFIFSRPISFRRLIPFDKPKR